jgi:transposase
MATREEWSKRVKRCERSGLDVAEFARREGIDRKQLYWWRWRLRSTEQSATPAEPAFLPVHVVASMSAPAATPPLESPPIEIALPNGRLVRVRAGFDAGTLERVLAIAADQEVAC